MMLYDVLKASKGLYVNDSFAMLWGKQLGGWTVTTLTGTLPMTFRSNGTALIDYRIYGTAEGAGVQTKNLFSGKGATVNMGSIALKRFLDSNIQVSLGEIYHINASSALCSRLAFYKDNARISTSSWVVSQSSITIPDNCNTAYVEVRNYAYGAITDEQLATATKIMLTEGSTPPETYIPYGYKLPLTVTGGAESKTADIFIGDTKLGAEDYIDYESGKIVRNGTPQDPPLPLPELETFEGTNTLDSTVEVGDVTITGKIKEAE